MSQSGNDGELLDEVAVELLTILEGQEAGLINWGFHDVGFVKDDIPPLLVRLTDKAAKAWEDLRAQGYTEEDLFHNLEERILIFRVGEGRYRTRFGESIRLFARLKQLFSLKDWGHAPNLVADLKVEVARRRYPRRDVPSATVLDDIASEGVPDPVIAGVDVLLRDGAGQPMDVAGFQQRAIEQQLQRLQANGESGLVIGAGTGSGKTKAFYVPAMAWIAANLTNVAAVQAIAIYPRIELLKDQFGEAYAEARKLDALQTGRGKRPLTIGAYYGDTPRDAQQLLENLDWRSSYWVCPYFRCPREQCRGSQLVWKRDLLERAARGGSSHSFERLSCPNEGCGFEVKADHLRLTRSSMKASPPDLLFTTTETLNQRMSSTDEFALFGVGSDNPPSLLLLDEIHTYEGLAGAQAAYLLRRWRHARTNGQHRTLCVVGLSATLAEAESFFSTLTGLSRHLTTYIRPEDDELVEEGAEYNVALKGDPASGVSLLSTAVQTAMLLGRVLDPLRFNVSPGKSPSRGALGRRVFAFTDQLDSVNRWYHIEVDAEKRPHGSRGNVSPGPPLASFRAREVAPDPFADETDYSEANEIARWKAGQRWDLCQEIGHELSQGLTVQIVSSQNQMSEASSDLVIATSSLEVGFNDPEVGAVLQYKAPKSRASFLQRKGRAGRSRTMRPWTMVVLSAFGRDRWAFQHAEEIFRPDLRPIELPVGNVYIQKIHATYALMDWLAVQLKQSNRRSVVWYLLAGNELSNQPSTVAMAIEILEDVLDNGWRRANMTRYLEGALAIGKEDLRRVMWDEPRPLMFDVIPTMIRQLRSKFSVVDRDNPGKRTAFELQTGRNPLPDYVPGNLFSDLNLPELVLRFPDQERRDPEAMNILPGMTAFAPGRVNKRFADKDWVKHAHWWEPPLNAPADGTWPIPPTVRLDPSVREIEVDGERVIVMRPRSYLLNRVHKSIAPSSMGTLHWRSQVRAIRPFASSAVPEQDDADTFELQRDETTPWSALVTSIAGFEHRAGRAVDVVRAAVGGMVETRWRGPYPDGSRTVPSDTRWRYRFTHDGRPAALGFTLSVDGVRFGYRPLAVDALLDSDAWRDIRVGLAPEAFRAALKADPYIAAVNMSAFEVDWLWELELTMLTATAIATGCTLAEATGTVDRTRNRMVNRTLSVIFQTRSAQNEDEENPDDDDALTDEDDIGPRQKRLQQLLERPEVLRGVTACRSILWDDSHPFLRPWLAEVYASSLGSAILEAALRMVPELNADALLLDVDPKHIWITESSGGGVGHVVRLIAALQSRPRAFARALDDVTATCERELLAENLEKIGRLASDFASGVARAFDEVRGRGNLRSQEETREKLARVLEQEGITASRGLMVSLNAKYLRAESDFTSDQVIFELISTWRREEQRLGCAIELRTFAVAAMKLAEIEGPLRALLNRLDPTGDGASDLRIFNVIQSLLWVTCNSSCPDCLERQPTYEIRPKPSRALLRSQLPPSAAPIPFEDPNMLLRAGETLAEQFGVTISCRLEDLRACAQVVTNLLTTPVDTEYQMLFPVIERISRDGHRWLISLVIRELSLG